MIQAHVGLLEGRSLNKTKALYAAFEKDSIMRLGTNESTGLAMIEANEPEAELFALAKQVDLAEKAFQRPRAPQQGAYRIFARAKHPDPRGVRSCLRFRRGMVERPRSRRQTQLLDRLILVLLCEGHDLWHPRISH